MGKGHGKVSRRKPIGVCLFSLPLTLLPSALHLRLTSSPRLTVLALPPSLVKMEQPLVIESCQNLRRTNKAVRGSPSDLLTRDGGAAGHLLSLRHPLPNGCIYEICPTCQNCFEDADDLCADDQTVLATSRRGRALSLKNTV